ncbi:efflux RND transporter periplasmic adaptor subunit [Paenarthrobacter nitroguajacolicus]|uniref:efflux RND transporter periplasmic adaptor subunit n=1 Tax=Paenarthrobacter nitroguajacolicus TaxID=211146 RepID=UPI00248C81DF|nr:efflux RND transporter periplasmic adaptor subunit [Paenarthrobacter nitroguajacolicus]MDI2035234.1 hypothetical protein [Paenarthrobacter nitroguajacolicus]
MGIFRRVILPVAWLLVFAVIAVALVKIAFVDGLKSAGSAPAPLAQVDIPVVPATRATVTNTVQIKGTVQSDAAEAVRSTSAGKVVQIFAEQGATVAKGDALFQVKAERTVVAQPSQDGPAAAPKPVYDYFDILAPRAGTLQQLTTLVDQQVNVGEAVGKIDPGTYTVAGPVTASQQYRLLDKPGPAEIALVGGPAPFQCSEVTLKNNSSDDGGTSSGGLAATGGGAGMGVAGAIAGPGSSSGTQPDGSSTPTGTISCAVPKDQQVFAGLGATMTVSAGVSPDVVTVPLTSVKGSVKDGIVWVAGATGGAPEQRTIQLGLNDGNVVEVTSGLTEGEQVLEFVPGTPAAQDPMMGPGQGTYIPAG